MANKGFISSATSFIRQIKQNLSEGRYTLGESGFAIIKELVQNADDAGQNGSSVLHIGIRGPISGADHPLLASPGLFVINDGTFEKHDAMNIRRFGENTKAMDAAKIGKFGLGLKSIFHLCEAFFFIGPAGLDDEGQFISDVLNPWSGDEDDNFHPEWDTFSEGDQKQLLRVLMPFLEGKPCFCLWIPLRQKRQLADNEPIWHFYPGDRPSDWLSPNEIVQDVAGLLPLLSNLRSIQFWSGIAHEPRRMFEVAITEGSERRLRFETLVSGQVHRFGGVITVDLLGNNVPVVYVGAEVNPGDSRLLELEHDEHWPSDLGRDPSSGHAKIIREKAQQHAGICISLGRRGKGTRRLSISWAVFLPLGEPEHIELPGVGFDLSIFLHGYFFVDAGRNSPVGLHGQAVPAESFTNDEQLRRAWNRRLADVGTLPLLPSVLEQLITANNSEIGESEMFAITRAIESSNIFVEFRNQICRNDCWASVYATTGHRTWKLFSEIERLVDLPYCSEEDLPWQVFPGLRTVVAEQNVSVRSSPRLVSSRCEAAWPAAAVDKLLTSVPAGKTIANATYTEYLTAFVDQLKEEDQFPQHARLIARIARTGMGRCGISTSDKQWHVRRLLQRIPSELRLPVVVEGDFGTSLFREISAHDVDIVFVPRELDPADSPGIARLKVEDAISLLKALSRRQERAEHPQERESISIMAGQLLQCVRDKADVLRSVAQLPLFTTRDCRLRRDRLATWSELQTCLHTKMLFALPSPRAYSLQRALAEDTVLLISSDCFRSLFPHDSPSQCEWSAIVDTMSQSTPPSLAGPADRAKVLEDLLNLRGDRRQGDVFRRCVRYLLHGDADHFGSSVPLLVGQLGQSDVWRRVTHISLSKQSGQWRLVDGELARQLRDQDKNDFNVQNIGAASAIALIKQSAPESFGELKPSPEEYSTLLRDIDDVDILSRLPIHEDSSGEHVSVGEGCYWQSDVPLPPELEQSVTILQRSGDPLTWRRQLDLARQLDATSLIEITLAQETPGRHWEIVMASLPIAHDLSADGLQRLATVAWLPTENDEFVAPIDMIDLSHLRDDVARLTADTPGIFYEPGMLKASVRKHPSYDLLKRRTFPRHEDALSMLGEVLIEDAHNHIGAIRHDRFQQWVDVARDMPKEILPCGTLIALYEGRLSVKGGFAQLIHRSSHSSIRASLGGPR